MTTAETNAVSTWPSRGDRRIEPVAVPKTHPSFRLGRGERIFTVGSCFARNIERALEARGFAVPAREHIRGGSDLSSFGPNILNAYGVASLLNEFRWALDDAQYDSQKNFVEVFAGHFVDLHLNNAFHPAPHDVVTRRRLAISSIYRKVTTCHAAIITLGDAECWFDKEAGLYLNTPPRETVIDRTGARFELHVLDYSDVFSILDELISLLKAKANLELKLILALSPTPLPRTHRSLDVLESNFYSKSVQRAAIEAIIAKHKNVDYFPIFESSILSSRDIWKDDLVHLEARFTDGHVARMISAYAEPADDDQLVAELQATDDKAPPAALFGRLEGKWDLLREHPSLALRFALAAVRLRRVTEAREAMSLLPEEFEDIERNWTEALILSTEQRHDLVVPLLRSTESEYGRRAQYWAMLATACFETGDIAAGRKAVEAWARQFPRSAEPYRTGAQYLARTENTQLTLYMFNKARLLARLEDEKNRLALDYGEYLAGLGRIALARAAIKEARPTNPSQAERLTELRLRLNMQLMRKADAAAPA